MNTKQKEDNLKMEQQEKQLFRMSKETSDIINALEAVNVGDVVTYEHLSVVAYGDVRGRCAGYLKSARDILLKEKQILFGVVRNVGLKRASDNEAVIDGEKGVSAIRRAAKRSALKTVCVRDFNSMSPEMKARHNATLSITGAINVATKPSMVKQVVRSTAEANDRLAVGRMLEILGK